MKYEGNAVQLSFLTARAPSASAAAQCASEWSVKVVPFLSWVGGKRRIVSRLQEFLPSNINSCRYIEPFLGAASLYLSVLPDRALLADANPFLISCYEYIRENPDRVAECLLQHSEKHGKRYYYEARKAYNESKPSAAQAARFIYLNKSCFNGIFRVNRRGEFNVPFGSKKSLILPSRKDLLGVSALLKSADLKCAPYEKTLEKAQRGDFVYLDPPYPPLNDTSFFTHYTKDRFSVEDQKNLSEQVRSLNSRGVRFLMTNADTPLVRKYYRSFGMSELSVVRYVTSSSVKHKARELIVRNYS